MYMLSNYLSVLESVTKDVLSERYVGEIHFRSYHELEAICLERIESQYSDQEISELKANVSSPKAEAVSFQSIIEGVKDYKKEVFIPRTAELRTALMSMLDEDDISNLHEFKSEYMDAIHCFYRQKIEDIRNDDRLSEDDIMESVKEYEIKLDAAKLAPDITFIKENLEHWYGFLHSLMLKIVSIPESYQELYIDLIKERFKIRLGKLGNILTTVTSFDDSDKLRSERNILELLFISVDE